MWFLCGILLYCLLYSYWFQPSCPAYSAFKEKRAAISNMHCRKHPLLVPFWWLVMMRNYWKSKMDYLLARGAIQERMWWEDLNPLWIMLKPTEVKQIDQLDESQKGKSNHSWINSLNISVLCKQRELPLVSTDIINLHLLCRISNTSSYWNDRIGPLSVIPKMTHIQFQDILYRATTKSVVSKAHFYALKLHLKWQKFEKELKVILITF